MHTELTNLYAELEEKKKIAKQMESIQIETVKLKEAKVGKQKGSLSQLEDRFKKLVDECKKSEMILINTNKIQSKHDAKIKELQEERNILNKKLESSSTRQNIADNDENVSKTINMNSSIARKV